MINIFIYIDALPLRYTSSPYMKYFSELTKNCDFVKLKNIIGYSFGIQSTILSGKLPQDHKHWMPYYYHPLKSASLFKVLGKINRKFNTNIEYPKLLKLMKYGLMSKILLKGKAGLCSIPFGMMDNFYIYPYYFMNELPFFDSLKNMIENKSNYKVTYIGPPTHRNYVLNCIKFLSSLNKDDDYMIFLYLDELDHIGHGYGADSYRWNNKLIETDIQIKNLFNYLTYNKYDYNIVIFSDHGISNIEKIIDINKLLGDIGLSWKNLIYLIDATIVNIWEENDAKKNMIISYLNNKIGNDIDIITKQQGKYLEKLGINFCNNAYGDIIIQCKPGKMFFPNHYSNLKAFKGAHGYLPKEDVQQSYLFFYSNCNKELMRLDHIKDIWDLFFYLTKNS